MAEYRPPLVGAACFDPYLALGTSNVPLNDEPGTTVVNMTAFVKGDVIDAQPVAIVTKNYKGAFWLITYKGDESILSSLAGNGPITEIEVPLDLHRHINAREVTPQTLKTLTANLKTLGIRKWSCFSHDLPYAIAGELPSINDLSQTVYAKAPALHRQVVVQGHHLHYSLSNTKEFSIGPDIYEAVPLVENGDAVVPKYVQLTIFLARKTTLVPLATVPAADPNFRYGYGFQYEDGQLLLMRPSTESSKKCCKYNRFYTYSIRGRLVSLKRAYLKLNLP